MQQWFKQATLRNTKLNGTDRYFFQLGILLLVFIRRGQSIYDHNFHIIYLY